MPRTHVGDVRRWLACLSFDPKGKLVKEIILHQVPMPTNCAFGGDDLSVLYVTSTWIRLPPGLSAQAPASGQLIAVQTDTRGQTPARFRKPN
jgi:sugar lactone lactonase YvrE